MDNRSGPQMKDNHGVSLYNVSGSYAVLSTFL